MFCLILNLYIKGCMLVTFIVALLLVTLLYHVGFCYCIVYFLQCVDCVLCCCTVHIYIFAHVVQENKSRLMQLSL